MAPLPAGWDETLTGEPMPNVAAAVRRSRESHCSRRPSRASRRRWGRSAVGGT